MSTFAVLTSPGLRRSGAAELVEAGLADLPGARVVDRAQLEAVTKELSLAALLGTDAAGQRLRLGRLVKSDALVFLNEERSPDDNRERVRVVISECSTGARLYVGLAPLPGTPTTRPAADLPSAVADAVALMRQRYPSGVRWVIGTSPFVCRNFTHEYDYYQETFAALVENALASQGGVAVLEKEEARAVVREQEVGAAAAGPTGAAGAQGGRVVPLMIEGEFEVVPTNPATQPTTATTGAGAPPAPPPAPVPQPDGTAGSAGVAGAAGADMNVAFTVTISDGNGPAQTLRRTVRLADVASFLTQDLVAAAMKVPLKARAPLSPDAQFEALVRRADAFDRVGAMAEAGPLREAALVLRPDDVTQIRLALAEGGAPSARRAAPGDRLKPYPDLKREDWVRQLERRQGVTHVRLEHLEYLIRHRAISRTQALVAAQGCRTCFYMAIPDATPQARRFFFEVYPLILGLAPGDSPGATTPGATTPAAIGAGAAPSAEEAEARDHLFWIMGFFGLPDYDIPVGPSFGFPLSAGGEEQLSDEEYQALAGLIEKSFPDDVYLPRGSLQLFVHDPGLPNLSPVPGQRQRLAPGPAPRGSGRPPSGPTVPAAAPATPPTTAPVVDDGPYVRFLDRVEKSGKIPYVYWARYGKLRRDCVRAALQSPDRTLPAGLKSRIDALEADYRALKLHGKPPIFGDPLVQSFLGLREQIHYPPPDLRNWWKPVAPSPVTPAVAAAPAAPPTANAAPPVAPTAPPIASTAPTDAKPPHAVAAGAPVPGHGGPLWFVPMPLQVKTLDGRVAAASRAISNNPLFAEHLLDAGPALDVFWGSMTGVFFWRQADLAEQVLNGDTIARRLAGPGVVPPHVMMMTITDVKWDGKRVWLGYTIDMTVPRGHVPTAGGIAVIESDGKTITWINEDQGLPPVERNLLLHPVSEGRVVAVGSFGPTQRGWCATVEAGGGAAPRVNVFHKAVVVPSRRPGAVDPNADVNAPDVVFVPDWLAEVRPPVSGGTPGGAPRLLLVGRAATLRPLVIDLDTLKVSASATPFGTTVYAPRAFLGSGDGLLEVRDDALYRSRLTWDGDRLSGSAELLAPAAADDPVPTGAPSRPRRRTLAGQFLRDGDSVYVPSQPPSFAEWMAQDETRPFWLRFDAKALAAERVSPDYFPWTYGGFQCLGTSSRFGMVAWGRRAARLVAAPQRPAGALRIDLDASLSRAGRGIQLEPAEPPDAETTAAAARTRAAAAPKYDMAKFLRREPTPDELAAALTDQSTFYTDALVRLAAMKPENYPEKQREAVAAALVPRVTADRDGTTHERVIEALAVWHTAESVPPLLAALHDKDMLARQWALEGLAACKDPAAIPEVAAILEKEPFGAAECLARTGPAAEPALLAALRETKSPDVRYAAVRALARAGTRQSVPALQSLLDSGRVDRMTADVIGQVMEKIARRP